MRRNLVKREEEEDGDAKAFLDWEMKVDQVLDYFDYSYYQKVRMVTYKFIGYASVEIREGRTRHVDTWLDLRREMRSRFVPTSYAGLVQHTTKVVTRVQKH
ncbi:hypothetical protein CR513_05143, partial [Mucuna pruriens]